MDEERRDFWVSRGVDSCDPPMAVAVVDERGFGEVTLRWLCAVADEENVSIDEHEIRVDLME